MTSRRLLVIDDNRQLVENLSDIFDSRGFSVVAVPRAKDGLAYAQKNGFDLAFVDVNLPDSSGLDLLPALRSAAPLGEVVLMTGHATIDSAIAAVRGGAFHYVVKPFKTDDLIATAESALRQVELRAERERLARRLDVSERRYRDVIESSQMLVVAVSANGNIQMMNRRALELTGYSFPELDGQPFAETLIPAESREIVKERLHHVLSATTAGEFEWPLLRRKGANRMVRWHATTAFEQESEQEQHGKHGNHTHASSTRKGLYLIGTDVTERLQLERRAAEAEALAQMGTLAAGLAHEIRNPLNAAGLQLHLIARHADRLPDEARGTLRPRIDIVAGELKRLERLLGDFLELARPRPTARDPVDIAILLTEIVALHEPAAHARGTHIVKKLGNYVVVGDRERLKQVFHNLIVNAMEATGDNDAITISTTVSESFHELAVTIADTGRGIPQVQVERVFEPFYTTKEAGTGLGLAIVRQIIGRHGGRVELHSVESKGTNVTIWLPVWDKV